MAEIKSFSEPDFDAYFTTLFLLKFPLYQYKKIKHSKARENSLFKLILLNENNSNYLKKLFD